MDISCKLRGNRVEYLGDCFRWMYWTNVYPQRPTIESAWMNGNNRTVLVNTRLGNPTGLVVDHSMDSRIYWCDSKENVIESMNPDGSNRVIVIGSSE